MVARTKSIAAFEDVELTQDELASLITTTALKTRIGGKDYDIDQSVIDKITKQILSQNTTAKWKGEGCGSAEKNAAEMAKQLAASGVTDINQVGQKKVTMPGQSTFDEQGNETISQDYTVTQIVNKATGLPLINDYGERGTGNAWSGTYTGDGNTAFRVNFDAKGNPIFYTTAASSNDLVNILGDDPILNAIAQIGAAYFGGPAGTAALQAAMGKNAEDIAKSAFLSYVGGQVTQGLSSGDSVTNVLGQTGADLTQSLVDTFGETGANIIAKTAGQFVTSEGQLDPLQVLLSNGVNAAANTLLNSIEGFKDLDLKQQKLVTGLATSYLNDGKLSPQEAINAAFSAATTAVKSPDQIEAQVKTAQDNQAARDAAISRELDSQLTIDASGASDIDAAAAFAEASGFNKFTFDGGTYTLDQGSAAKNIAELEAEVAATQAAEKAAAQAATTAANLKGEDFEGYDAAVAAQAAANNVAIGNEEANDLDEAGALAKLRNPTATQFTYGGRTYTMGTSSAALAQAVADAKAVEFQDKINSAPTRAAAYKLAREELGAGKTFTYNGKEYSTATAEERPDLTGKPALAAAVDQNAAETNRLLAQNKTLEDAAVANQSPAEISRLLRQNAELIKGNVTINQSGAETARLRSLNNILVLGNAPNESTAETQRLMESGQRSVSQNIDAMAMQALGTTARGVASLISNAGQTYAQLTGDFNYENSATRLGKEIAEYAKSKDVYGLDVQKERITQGLAQANQTDNFFEKVVIIGKTIKNNPLGFFDVAGSEIVEELPETAIQIAIALMTGGSSMAIRVGGKFIQGSASLVGSFTENFGSAGKEAYDKSIARGDSVDVARNKAYINASISAVAEMVPSFIADKALVGPIMKGFSEQTLKRLATGYVTNASVGVVSEFISGAAQNYSTQYVVDPTKASWSNSVTSGIFEATIGGTVQTTMATPTTVIDTAAVIGRDFSGKDVTLQQVMDGGSNIDASTVKADTAIATNSDGTKLTVGSSIASAQANNTGIDVIGSFLPSNLTSGDITVSTDVKGNEVTLNELVTDLTGTPANITGSSDTSTVLAVDTSAGTAVVMNAAGSTDVVNVTGAVTVGSVVKVDAATGDATATGAVVDTTANTGTVTALDTTSGTAIVTNANGSSQVVNAGSDVTTGSTVVIDSSGTATVTDAATAAATNAATTAAATAATATAADAATTATAQAAADAATTNATVVSLDTGTGTALVVDSSGSTDIVTVTGDVTVGSTVVVDSATGTATAADSAAAATTNAATAAATAADAATAAATDAATTAANATNATASTDVATATDAAAAATDAATTAANAAAATATDAATATVLSVDAATGTALVVDASGATDVVAVTGDVTAGSTVIVDSGTGTAVAAGTGAATDAATDAVLDTSAATTGTVLSVDTNTGTALVVDSNGSTDVVNVTGDVTVGSTVVVDSSTGTGVVTDSDTGVVTDTGAASDVVTDASTGVVTDATTATVLDVDSSTGTALVVDSTGATDVVNVTGDVVVGSTVVVDTSTGTGVVTDAVVDPAVIADAVVDPAVVTDSVLDTTVVADPVLDTTVVTDVVADPVLDPVVDPVLDPVVIADPAVDPVLDPVVVTDPIVDSVVDPVVDPVVVTTPVITSTVIAINHNNNTIITQDSTGKVHFIDSPGDDVAIGDTVDLPPVLPPVSPVSPPVSPVLPTVSPEVSQVSTPEVIPTTPTPKVPTPKVPTIPSGGGGGGGFAGGAETAPLANVFYYGKDFSSQRQQIGPGGRLIQTPYRELSVEIPGAEAPVAQQGRTEENTTEAMLQKILSQQDDNVTMDELMRLLG